MDEGAMGWLDDHDDTYAQFARPLYRHTFAVYKFDIVRVRKTVLWDTREVVSKEFATTLSLLGWFKDHVSVRIVMAVRLDSIFLKNRFCQHAVRRLSWEQVGYDM